METLAQVNLKKTFAVKGMSCASCAASVENALRAQEGVNKANVNFSSNSVFIDYNPSATNPDILKRSVNNIGYDLVTAQVSVEDIKKVRHGEYLALRNNLILSALLSAPVFIISMFHLHIPYREWLMLALSIPVVFWCGLHFYINAWKKLRHGSANMDTLIALGTGVAFIYSLFNTLFPEYLVSFGIEPHVYYEATVTIITLVLFGNLLEARAKEKTSTAIEKLIGLQPVNATLLVEGMQVVVPVNDVQVDDIVLIRPGEKIPVDGKVIEGASYVDESMVTGEALAVRKKKDDVVLGGTINKNGSFSMRAEKVGTDTMLSRIIRLVQEAQGSKAPVQRLADKIASVFVPVVVGLALISFGIWLYFGPEPSFTNAVVILVTVLIIACPCALGLATPTAITVGIGKGALQGILIRNAEALEKSRDIDVLLVDKTGTITKGKPEVTDLIVSENIGPELFRNVVFSIESRSEHPLAEAIAEWMKEKENGMQLQVSAFESIPGKGVTAIHEGQGYSIGSVRLANEKGATNRELHHKISELEREGKTVVTVLREKELVGLIALKDSLKESVHEAIKSLKEMGIKVVMLTGDSRHNAESIGKEAGIDEIIAEVLPEDKAVWVGKFQAEGKKVAMAGDGINDAPALAMADVGIAMGTGTDIAMESAPITLVKGDIEKIAGAIRLSRETVKTIRQNLFWAFFYNIISIPIAAGILYPVNGFLLNPMIAGGAMAFSSVSVVMNSLRLKVKKLN